VQPAGPHTPAPRAAETNGRTKIPQIPPALKASIELAAELAKKELSFEGKVGAMAVFVYPGNGAGNELGDPATVAKTVSLSSRNELQKEAVRKRITEKVRAETVSTVVIVADGKKERAVRGPNNPAVISGSIVISGATPSSTASASVAYTFDKSAKTFSLWDLRWLDTAVDNYFLQGVFGAHESRPANSGNRHRRAR